MYTIVLRKQLIGEMYMKSLSRNNNEEQAEVFQKLMQLFFKNCGEAEKLLQGMELVKEIFHLESIVIYEYTRKKQHYELLLKENRKKYSNFQNIKNGHYLKKGICGVIYPIKHEDVKMGTIIARAKSGRDENIKMQRSFFENCISILALAYIRKMQSQMDYSKNEYIYNIQQRNPAAMVQLVFKHNKYVILSYNEEVLKMFGYTSEKFDAEFRNNIEGLVCLEDYGYMKNIWHGLKLNGGGREYINRYINSYGELRWAHSTVSKILNQEAIPVIQVIFKDITQERQLKIDLEHEKERYRLAVNSSLDVIFEYDIKKDIFVSYGSFVHKDIPKSTPILIRGYKEKLLEGKMVYKEDTDKVFCFIQGISERPYEAREYYEENGEGKYLWVLTQGTFIYENGIPVKIIGKKTNITEKKKKEQKELEVIQRDKLTKLYTKQVGENLIRQYLTEKTKDEIACLMLIDLDNFKQVNDTYGYMFGDAILKEVSEVIRSATRQRDIIVRYGGDEFLVLMKNTERYKTMDYGKRVYDKICSLYAGEDENIHISCSIGMVCTLETDDYDMMFQRAEQSLAYVKEKENENVSCYCAMESENEKETFTEKRYFEKKTESYENQNRSEQDNEDIVSFAFAILEKTKDLRSAINLLLSRVGREFGLAKISVLETEPNFLCNIITYQWAADKKNYNSICKYEITKEEIENWSGHFGADGIFTINAEEKETLQKGFRIENPEDKIFRAKLYSAIYEEGELKGSIVFEHEKEMYHWSDEMKTTMKEISKIISTHIVKANADIASKAKTEFLSRMSHEIRTPMNAIVGMTNIAKSVIGDDEKIEDCLQKIDTSTKYLLSLINDILDMSRIESGNMTVCKESFDLENLMEELIVLMRSQAESRNIHLIIEKSYTDTKLIGDELRLNQVLINIIGNALKFTPEHGSITVSVEQILQEDETAGMRFSVKDTGIGIKKENLLRIFHSFEQAEESTAKKYGGTGLGLAISSNLVKLMGGKLEVKSEVGVGSEFYFTIMFPRDKEGSNTEKIHPIASDMEKRSYDFSGKRILLVEDNELNAEIAKTILEMAGIVIEVAENGKEAVEIFEERPIEYYDAILMDIRMPVMDGLEATKRIRTLGKEDSRTVPIIAMTANAFDEDTKKSIESGMNGHLSKPIDIEHLYQVLEGIMEEKCKKE